MQKRRRKEALPVRTPYGGSVTVPDGYWDALKEMDAKAVCEAAGAFLEAPDSLVLKVLGQDIRIGLSGKCLQRWETNTWEPLRDPYLEFLVLLYLLNVKQSGIQHEMVSVHDLKDAHFFQGPHALETEALLTRFGAKPAELEYAGQRLEGSLLEMADAAVCLKPFPKIPLYYVLWAGDEEFPAILSILFDRSIEKHLSADAIWGVVRWVSDVLLNA